PATIKTPASAALALLPHVPPQFLPCNNSPAGSTNRKYLAAWRSDQRASARLPQGPEVIYPRKRAAFDRRLDSRRTPEARRRIVCCFHPILTAGNRAIPAYPSPLKAPSQKDRPGEREFGPACAFSQTREIPQTHPARRELLCRLDKPVSLPHA